MDILETHKKYAEKLLKARKKKFICDVHELNNGEYLVYSDYQNPLTELKDFERSSTEK